IETNGELDRLLVGFRCGLLLGLLRGGAWLKPNDWFGAVGHVRMPGQTKVVQALRYHLCWTNGIKVALALNRSPRQPAVGWYGVSKRISRLTRTLKRKPTGTLIVGWMFKFRRVTSAPSCEICAPTALPAVSAADGYPRTVP